MKKILIASLAATGLLAMSLTGAFADGLDQLPADQQKLYEHLDPQVPVGPGAFKDFKAPRKAPWKIGYASTYAGNTWRANLLDEFANKIVPEYKKLGLVSEFVVTQSDLKDPVQIQQMRQMIDDGVDAILICCSNVTALNQTIEYAHSKGVPVVSFSGYVTSPYALTASENNTDGGFAAGKWMGERLKGKGNVLLVSGIPGFASSDSFDVGVKKALEAFPDVKLVGNVAGNWTDQVAQVEVQKFLATNPGQLDGIIVQSAAENGVVNAVKQSGRPMMPIVLGGEASAACFWRKNPDFIDTSFHFWPPRAEARMAWDVMMRTLQGQGPKIQSMLRPAIPYTIADVNAALPENCDENSTDWIEPTAEQWWPKAVADQYFYRPADPTAYKP